MTDSPTPTPKASGTDRAPASRRPLAAREPGPRSHAHRHCPFPPGAPRGPSRSCPSPRSRFSGWSSTTAGRLPKAFAGTGGRRPRLDRPGRARDGARARGRGPRSTRYHAVADLFRLEGWPCAPSPGCRLPLGAPPRGKCKRPSILARCWPRIFLGPLRITQYRLAKGTRVPPRRINEIVHGVRAVTADTALRLARFFGTSEQFWLNLQTRLRSREGKGTASERHCSGTWRCGTQWRLQGRSPWRAPISRGPSLATPDAPA